MCDKHPEDSCVSLKEHTDMRFRYIAEALVLARETQDARHEAKLNNVKFIVSSGIALGIALVAILNAIK